MTGDRSIPGPIVAYLRVYEILPTALRAVELRALETGGPKMRDGMFAVEYVGAQGGGGASLVFQDGLVYGVDVGDASYDGTYEFDARSGLVNVRVKITFPPGGMTVFGVSNPYEWSIDAESQFDPLQNSGPLQIRTSFGKIVDAKFRFLRTLPQAA
jgi:hypothetical protein